MEPEAPTFPITDRKWRDDVVRVLVCDESALFRRRLVIVLEADPDIEVVAEAPDADAARSAALQHAPDVVVVSSELPSLGGDRTTLAVRETNPGVGVLVVYDADEADRSGRELTRGLRAGAAGLVPRHAAADRVVEAVRTLGRGRPVLEPTLARGVLAEYADRAHPVLTDREREALDRVARGAVRGPAGAAEGPAGAVEGPGQSVHQVENLVANALAKLQRAARAEGRARLRRSRPADG